MEKNNWYAVVGGPSSGKTTILKELERRGYTVVYEMARLYIDQELAKGRTIEDIRGDELAFQRKLLELKVDFEKQLDPDKFIFIEQAIPSSTAYYQENCGVTDDPFLQESVNNSHYNKVFVMEMLEFLDDYSRTETPEQAKKLEMALEQAYQGKGEVIKVPWMPIQDRINFILSQPA